MFNLNCTNQSGLTVKSTVNGVDKPITYLHEQKKEEITDF